MCIIIIIIIIIIGSKTLHMAGIRKKRLNGTLHGCRRQAHWREQGHETWISPTTMADDLALPAVSYRYYRRLIICVI